MAHWDFTPKTVGAHARPLRGSGSNRSWGLLIAVAVLLALYFIGCADIGVRSMLYGW